MPINKRTDGHTVAARTGECSARKRNELLIPATAWMGSDHHAGQRQSARGEGALCDPFFLRIPTKRQTPYHPEGEPPWSGERPMGVSGRMMTVAHEETSGATNMYVSLKVVVASLVPVYFQTYQRVPFKHVV